jgi:threonine dehydratase
LAASKEKGNAIMSADREKLVEGVWTPSAGNMAQGVAWFARRAGIACTAVVPDDAPVVKLEAINRLDARITKVPFSDFQAIQREHEYPGMKGLLIHPFGDDAVMAGNGTIGLEILEEYPGVDAVIVPYGGGGLSCGIASAIKASALKLRYTRLR